MKCSEVVANLSLYLYGELDFASEEAVEIHLAGCSVCQLALNREKEWHAALNLQQRDVSPEWLAACRTDLKSRIATQPTTAAQMWHGLSEKLREIFDFRLTDRSYRLAAVSFLLIAGFGAGRYFSALRLPFAPNPVASAGFLDAPVTRVQAVRPEAGNRVHIVLQRVQVREITGSREDNGVREILLGAARESEDPGIRMDSVEMLAGQNDQQIRNAIVNTVTNDPNAAVRLKAIETLRQLPSDAVTRGALEFALAHDQDPGVRTEAMDVLVPANGTVQVTPQLIQTFSDAMQSLPADDYVRLRCLQILNGQAASHDTY